MRKILSLFVSVFCLSIAGGGCGGVSDSALRRAAMRKSPDSDPPAAPAIVSDVKSADSGGKTGSSTAGTESSKSTAQTPKPDAEVPAVSNQKPEHPLTEMERRARSISNLERVGKALSAYTTKHG